MVEQSVVSLAVKLVVWMDVKMVERTAASWGEMRVVY